MPQWTVEIAEDLLESVAGSLGRQLELDAVQRVIRADGPDGMGAAAMDIEGLPSWDNRGSPVSLMLVAPLPSGYQRLMLDVHPGHRVIVVELG